MDRRDFVASFAALSASTAFPSLAAAQTSSEPAPDTHPKGDSALRMAALVDQTTQQLTTFNLTRKSKAFPVPRGKRVTIGEVKGRSYIAQFWLTFPGWFLATLEHQSAHQSIDPQNAHPENLLGRGGTTGGCCARRRFLRRRIV